MYIYIYTWEIAALGPCVSSLWTLSLSLSLYLGDRCKGAPG